MTLPKQSMPSDWMEFNLGDLLKFSNGINADKTAYGSGVPFANVLEVITNESLRKQDIPGRIKLPHNFKNRYEVRCGDVLFNRTSETQGEVGLASVYVGDEPVVFGGFVFRGRPLTSSLDIHYSKYALRSATVRNQIVSRGQGGIRANVGQRDLKSVVVMLPGLAEQRAIAEALDDASSHIKLLERLISKKQAIKQGMLRQLLTGRTRLSGFVIPWEQGEIGALLEFKNGLNKAGKFFGSGTPIVNFMDVMNGPIITAADLRGRVMLTRQEAKRFSAKRGDMFFTRTSETVDEVGTAAVLVDDVPNASFSGFILRGRPRSKDCDPRFLAYLFQTESVRRQVTSGATYTTRALTNGRLLSRVAVHIPPVDEQRAIGAVLADCESELALLRKRLYKARSIKQGMMEQLLTGRTRLPVGESA
jgi:type I restriction enzyme S subunit